MWGRWTLPGASTISDHEYGGECEMPDVLVLYASKMGATREIAEVVAEEIRGGGLSVTVGAAAELPDPSDYRVVVLGSGLYLRRWRRDAVRYLRNYRAELLVREVWLFQSGPCGENATTSEMSVPSSVRRLADQIEAPLPVTFGGRLDPQHATGFLTRWVAASKELRGDFRDWNAIRAWARGIAAGLAPEVVRSEQPDPGSGRTTDDGNADASAQPSEAQ